MRKLKFAIGKNEILAKNYKTRVAHFIKEVISSDFTYAFYRCLTNRLLKMTITMPIRVSPIARIAIWHTIPSVSARQSKKGFETP
jgi:hypothetical protein